MRIQAREPILCQNPLEKNLHMKIKHLAATVSFACLLLISSANAQGPDIVVHQLGVVRVQRERRRAPRLLLPP